MSRCSEKLLCLSSCTCTMEGTWLQTRVFLHFTGAQRETARRFTWGLTTISFRSGGGTLSWASVQFLQFTLGSCWLQSSYSRFITSPEKSGWRREALQMPYKWASVGVRWMQAASLLMCTSTLTVQKSDLICGHTYKAVQRVAAWAGIHVWPGRAKVAAAVLSLAASWPHNDDPPVLPCTAEQNFHFCF